MNAPTHDTSLTVVQADKSIGDIIRAAHNLSAEQVEQVLSHQRTTGMKFGEAAVALGLVNRDHVIWALSQQFSYDYEADAANYRELVVASSPFSQQAETFRELRTQLLHTVMAKGSSSRALAVISQDFGDGKTYFAANLAVAFSQLGGRVLLMDADLRTPRAHSIMKTEAQTGLSGVLAGRSEATVVRPLESLPNLFLLPVGVVPPNPTELLQRPTFSVLLDDLKTRFDHIIVDTPAAVCGADARVVAATCGAALLVGRKNKTRMPELKQLADAVQRLGAQVAGIAINEFGA